MTSTSPAQTEKRRKTLSERFSSGGRPPFRPVDLILLGIGLVMLVSGVVMTRSASRPDPVVEATKASVTSVLDAAAAGHIASARLSPVSGLGTAVVKGTVASGMLAEDLGKTVTDGELIRFTAPVSVQNLLATTLAEAEVPLWMDSTARVATGAVMPGPGVTATAMRVPPVESSNSNPFGILLLVGGVIVALVGLVRLVSYRSSVKAEKKAEAKVESNIPTTRFSDVAGAEEAVEQLREIVDCLKDPDSFRRLGAKIPKGALMVGPPGTGKTLLARAVAGEAGVKFFNCAGSDFVEMYVGVGPKRVRSLFAQARKAERAIIFIDEIDAVARKRSGDTERSNGHTEGENTLIALLSEMDGFSESNVVVIGATNRPDILDPAITRPGRLDRRVEVPLPDRRGRQHILGVHSREMPLADDVNFEAVAARTPGFSGAQLEAVMNEAALEAVRRRQDLVDSSCIDAAIAMVAMGRARASALVTEHDRRVTAWHEAGHTVAALLLAEADAPVQVSIVPRGPAGGVTWMSGSDDLFLSRAKAHAQLVVALAGRAAEELYMDGEFTQGAASDLDQATNNALLMATRYGMTRLGLASRERHLGGTTTKEVAEVVEELLADARDEATVLLTEHRDLVEAIAEALLDKEDLDAADLAAIAQDCGVEPAYRPVPLPAPPVHSRRGPGDDPGTPAPTPTSVPVFQPKTEAPSRRGGKPTGAGRIRKSVSAFLNEWRGRGKNLA